MSAPLQHNVQAPNSIAFLLAWMAPISPSPGHQGAKRWAAGMPLPYRAVTRVAGLVTPYGDYPTLRVHTFGASETEALREGDRTDSRLMVLADHPGWDVDMPGGVTAHCDWLEITAAAHEEPYGAESVVTRVVTECQLCLSPVPVAVFDGSV